MPLLLYARFVLLAAVVLVTACSIWAELTSRE